MPIMDNLSNVTNTPVSMRDNKMQDFNRIQ